LTCCFIDLRTVALGLQDVSNPDAPQRLTRKHRRPARPVGRGEPAGSSASRWEHEAVLEAVQARLDRNPDKMRVRRQTVEHPFGTIKSWMGSTHFQMKTLKHVSTEMALHVLAYNMKRLISILGVGGLIQAIRT
jgi:hypothetical protein